MSPATPAGPAGSEDVVTLLALAPPDGTTRFVDQIVRDAPPGSAFRYFSWPRALLGRYDVLHVHWPEFLLRSGTRRGSATKAALFLLLVARLRATGTPVVRTLHNLKPHTPGSWTEAVLLELLDARVRHHITLNPVTRVPSRRPSTHIPHAHYRDVLPSARRCGRPGTALFVGRIEPYKNVPHLLGVFATLPDPELRLRVVGQADRPLREELQGLAEADPRVGVRFGFVPDADLAAEVAEASLVVLPYSELHNSGVLLVALSLGRPVLVPRTPTTDQLADEVGADWVRRYDGELGADDLEAALRAAPGTARGAAPRLDGRDWPSVAAAHQAVYRRVVAERAVARAAETGPGARRAERTRVYVYPSGQRNNLGDSVLRRAYLDALRRHGRLHVCVGPDDGYVSGLGLRPGDVVHASPPRWLASALSPRPFRLVAALNAGELVLDTRFAAGVPGKLALALLASLRGGRTVAVGLGVRSPGSRLGRSALRALLRPVSLLAWRDPQSRAWLGQGEVAPDWALALGTPVPELRTEEAPRDVLAVCLRGDRPVPSERWFETVRLLALAHDAELVVVTQMTGDEPRAEEVAARLGASRLPWTGGSHAEHERAVRAVYRRSVAVVSDRIHALILGLTEGAVPVGYTTGRAEKIERTFAAFSTLPVAFSDAELDAGDDPLARAQALVAQRATFLDDLDAARDVLEELAQELGTTAGAGVRRSRVDMERSAARSRRTGRTTVPTSAR